MGRILNTYKTNGNTTIIIICRDDSKHYLVEVLIDTEDIHKINGNVYINKTYPYIKKSGSLQNIIMGRTASKHVVVDHINGNRLDNRKVNLRVVTHQQNNTNRLKTKSNIGINGVSERKNGNYHYFRASVSDLSDTVAYSNSGAKRTKRYSKQFNIRKLGRDEALKQAKKWLQTKKLEFGYLMPTTKPQNAERLSKAHYNSGSE